MMTQINDDAPGETASRENVATDAGATSQTWGRSDRWAIAALVVVVVLMWVPRLRGPIDLRWDAAVYYTTATAIVEGKGYRLPSEPGEVLAVQYPPLLPAVTAAVQWACGTTDYQVAGQWLRILYSLVYATYVFATYALARRFFATWLAFGATLVVALSFQTIFMSDLLFAEIPFATCMVGVILLNRRSDRPAAFAGQTALAWAAFLFRSAGLGLLVAWVGDAVLRRRWKLVAARAVLAAVPVLAWQGYVMSVTHRPEYVHPAYEYQRASYQYYNVPYAENLKLIDPFKPELGRTTTADLAIRVVRHAPALIRGFGHSMMSSAGHWRAVVTKSVRALGITPPSRTIALSTRVAVYVLGAGVTLGIVLLLWRCEWMIGLAILALGGLMATTPWPEQFGRYLGPTIPLLTIALLVALQWLGRFLPSRATKRDASVVPVTIVLACLIVVHLVVAFDIFRPHLARLVGRGPASDDPSRLLFYSTDDWRMYDLAIDWLRDHAPMDAIVVTDAPQWVYMRSGLKSVMIPMVADAAEADRLIADVPSMYAIDDQVDIGTITSRYLRPAVSHAGNGWRTVFVTPDGKTKVLERVPGTSAQ